MEVGIIICVVGLLFLISGLLGVIKVEKHERWVIGYISSMILVVGLVNIVSSIG